jgi:DNA invertase Pin-like site-specific DNA recombinase
MTISSEIKEKWPQLYESGLSTIAIAKEFNCSFPPVLKHLRSCGLEIRNRKTSWLYNKKAIPIEVKQKFKEQYLAGKNAREIAEMFNVSHCSVRRYLNKIGVYQHKEKKSKVSMEIKKKFKKLYLNGKNTSEIGRMFNVSYNSVRRYLEKIGIYKTRKDFGICINGKSYCIVKGYLYRSLGRYYYHREVAEKVLNRKLSSKEIIHHIDEDKLNNDVSNLMLFKSRGEHLKHHKLKEHIKGIRLI